MSLYVFITTVILHNFYLKKKKNYRFEKLNMKTKVGYGVVLGTMISLGGALLLTMYQGIPLSKLHAQATTSNVHAGHENWIKGCVLLFTGVTLFSSWMLIQAKINVNYPCPYSSTVMLSVFGTFQCAILSLFKTRHVDEWILRDKLTIITVIVAVCTFIYIRRIDHDNQTLIYCMYVCL